MRNLQNLHTHSTYCDGKHTPEEMIAFALEKGFDSLGFSGHSYMSYSTHSHATLEKTEAYKKEVSALKEKYRGQLDIYLGLEVDMYSQASRDGFDYHIGAVHYLKLGEEYIPFDRKADVVKSVIDTYFGGNGMAFVKEYYRQIAQLPLYGTFDILGHFDLITKNLDFYPFVDEQSSEYLHYALEALEALQGHIPFFEVNTGAMARGYRTTPYPSGALLKEFKRLGFRAIISSDCHDGNQLDCGFKEARALLERCGFQERYILTDSGFRAVEL